MSNVVTKEDDPFANFVVDDTPATGASQEDPFANFTVEGSGTSEEAATPTPERLPASDRSLDTTMWDGMDYKDAMSEYEAMEQDPNVSVTYLPDASTGSMLPRKTLMYDNPETGTKQAIPRPSADRFSTMGVIKGAKDLITGDASLGEVAGRAYDRAIGNPKADVSAADKATLGMAEMLGDVAETGAAIADQVYDTDLTEKVRANTIEVDTSKSVVDSLIADGIPLLLSSAVGAGVATKIAAYGPRWLRGMAMVLGSEATASAGTATDEGTLFIGPDAAFKSGILSQGLDMGDDASDAVLEQRAAVFAEGLLVGSVVSGVTQTTVWTSKFAGMFFGDFTDLLKKNGPEAEVYRQLSYQLSKVTPDTTAAELAIIRDQVGKVVKENSTIVNQLAEQGSESAKVKLTTIQSLMQGTTDPAEIARLQSIGTGFGTPANADFIAAQKNVTRSLQEGLERQADELGGVGATAQTRTIGEGGDAIADAGRMPVLAADADLAAQETIYKQMEQRFWEDVRDNPEFGDTLNRLADTVGTDQGALRRETGENIQATLRDIYGEMKTTKDSLYKAISGGTVDGEKVVDTFSYLNNNAILPEIDKMNNSSIIKKFVTEIKPQPIIDPATGTALLDDAGEAVFETAEEVATRVQNWIAANDEGLGEFGFMYQKVRPELSELAESFYARGDNTAGKEIRNLVRFIDGELTDDVGRINPQLKDQVEAARSYFRNDFAPFFSAADAKAQTPLTRYAGIYDATIGRTGNGMADDFGKQGFESNAMSGIDAVIQDKSKYDVAALRDVLNRPEGKNLADSASGSDVADYYVYEMLENFGAEIQIKGGLDKADLTRLNDIVRNYQDVLAPVFPKKAEELNTFISAINTKTGSLAEQTAMIDRVQKVAKATRERTLKGVLKPFFDNEGLDTAGDLYGSFKTLFTSKDPVGNLTKARKFISTLPVERQDVAERGLKTAFNRYFRDYMFSTSPEAGGTLTLSGARAFGSKEEFNQFFNLVDGVFEDTPTVSQSIKEMTVVASELQAARGAVPNKGWSPTEYAKSAKEAVSRGIYASVGPLSKKGTRIRSILSLVVKNKADPEVLQGFMTKMLSDPEYYHQLTLKYNKAPRDPRVLSEVSRWLGSVGTKMSGDDTSDNPDATQDEMSGIFGGVRQAISNTVSEVGDALSDEMNQIGVAIDTVDEMRK